MDCEWIDKNIEAILSDDLSGDDSRLARGHISGCERCRKEVQSLIAIDPLIKKYFQAQLHRAMNPRPSHGSAVWRRRAWSGASVAILAAILFAIIPRNPQVDNSPSTIAVQPQVALIAPVESPSVSKNEAVSEDERAKPSATTGDNAIFPSSEPAPDAPAFLVMDPAGYSRTLDDFRGFTTLIGFWSADQPEAIANLERLYKTFGRNAKFRLVGVSSQRGVQKPANTTFPLFHNQGSRALAGPGEFVLLSETGEVRMRG